MPAFPALEEILQQAEDIRTNEVATHSHSQMAIDLEKAWRECVMERSATGTRSGGKPKSPASSDQEWHADCLH